MTNCQLNQPMGLAPEALASFVEQVRRTCQCNQCASHRTAANMLRESLRDGWIMGEHPVRFLRGNDHD
jgi:hypothetical protein